MSHERLARGRPVTVDRAAVSARAVELFDRRGYETTNMDDVAKALGVSRRSLFRHFPVKGSLIWYGFEPFVQRFRANLAAATAVEPAMRSIERAFVEAVTTESEDLRAARIRLVLIHRHLELRAYNSAGLSEVRDRIQAFLEHRLELGVDSLESIVLADAVTAAVFAALRHWAVADTGPSPVPTMHRAFLTLTELLPS